MQLFNRSVSNFLIPDANREVELKPSQRCPSTGSQPSIAPTRKVLFEVFRHRSCAVSKPWPLVQKGPGHCVFSIEQKDYSGMDCRLPQVTPRKECAFHAIDPSEGRPGGVGSCCPTLSSHTCRVSSAVAGAPRHLLGGNSYCSGCAAFISPCGWVPSLYDTSASSLCRDPRPLLPLRFLQGCLP